MDKETRLVIIGGVAGGASAAARARRISENAQITLIERGGYVSFANCGLPYYIGGTITDRKRLLVQTPESLYANLRIDVRVNTEAVSIDRAAKKVNVRSVTNGTRYSIDYDKLILSPGAVPVKPPIPGLDNDGVFTLRSIEDMDLIVESLDRYKPTHSVVIGGGYIGLEMAEALRQRGIGVTLVEQTSQVMGTVDHEIAASLHQHLLSKGVDLRLETSVTSVTSKDGGLTARLSTGEEVNCGIIIASVGVRPEVTLARDAGLEIGPLGGIVVDEYMRTSDPDIFAVGDAVEVSHYVGGFQTLIPLAGPANRQGRIAADNALGRSSKYEGSQGTGICKVFDMTVGMTGLNEKTLRKTGSAYEKVYVHPLNHAGYYPGASPMTLKLLFDPNDGRVLGAQAVGTDGVDKRIDVLAVAIRAGMTVFDLENLELAYAPPYGSAKDPVNYAGFVAANILRGDVQIVNAEEIANPREDQVILDVRKDFEVATGTIPGAVHIPLDELRDRIGELPNDKEILAYCQVGLRGYLACRLLTQKGFRCRNLNGGIKTYVAVTGNAPKVAPQPSVPCNDPGVECPVLIPERASDLSVSSSRLVDARGLQCPGPIMQVASEIQNIKEGETLTVLSTDPAFMTDVRAWCHSTGNVLVEAFAEDGHFKAVISKGAPVQAQRAIPDERSKKKTIVVFSGDFDKVTAAFIIANGAASMGSDVTMFFTFWGLNALRRPGKVRVAKNLIERMFGIMMPRGADRLKLSKMNMGGIGLAMIKRIMRRKKVPSLPELIASAQAAGVKLVACSMSMDLMGIKREELIDGIEEGGVAMYLDRAEAGNVNLFI